MEKFLLFMVLWLAGIGGVLGQTTLVKYQGYADQGNRQVSLQGFRSAEKVAQVFPGATVTVYETGTLTLATLYSDGSSTPKSNPFTATSEGWVEFYTAAGVYDIRFSGTGITTPFTRSAVRLGLTATEITGGVADNSLTVKGKGRAGYFKRYTLSTLPTCDVSATDASVVLTDSRKTKYSCREVSSGVYKWVPDTTVFDIQLYGAIPNDGVDDRTAIVNTVAAISANSGGVLSIPDGQWDVNTGGGVIALPANVVVRGNGKYVSKINIIGTSPNNVFSATDVSNVTIEHVGVCGNSQASGSGNGLAFDYTLSSGATASVENINIHHCHFENFKGDWWLNYYNNNPTYLISYITIDDNTFKSFSGNARNGATVTVPSSNIGIYTAPGQSNKIYSTKIRRNTSDAYYIKSFIQAYYGINDFLVEGNILTRVGLHSSISDDAGAYATMVYDSSGVSAPSNVRFVNNDILGVRSVGYYLAGCHDVLVQGGKTTGQTDTVNIDLPKGAIVNNGTSTVVVRNVTIEECKRGFITVNQGGLSDTLVMDGFAFTNLTTTAAIPIELAGCCTVGNGFSADISGVRINNTTTSGRGIFLQSTSSFTPGKLRISDFNIRATFSGIEQYSGDATVPIYGEVEISNGIIYIDNGTALSWGNCSNTNTRAKISNLRLTGASGTNLFNATSSKGLAIKDIEFFNHAGGGIAFNNTSAEGTLDGIKYTNVTSSKYPASGTRLGVSAPSHTGVVNDFVQNLAPVETGSTGAKYTVNGWMWDTGTSTWKEQRVTSQASYGSGASPSFVDAAVSGVATTNRLVITNTDNATAVAGVTTCNTQMGYVTSESLTTAAGATYVLTLNNNYVTSTSKVYASVSNGTNTGGLPMIATVAKGSNVTTITVKNVHSADAFNGTIKIDFIVFN